MEEEEEESLWRRRRRKNSLFKAHEVNEEEPQRDREDKEEGKGLLCERSSRSVERN